MGVAKVLIRQFFNRALRLPKPRAPHACVAGPVSRVVVFGKFPNPTFDYYFSARLSAEGMPEYKLINISDFDSTIEASETFIIVVRYASLEIAKWIRRNRARVAGVVIFVDDDIAAAITSSQASWRYRYRLLSQSILPLRLIDGLIDDVWVSTESLAARLDYLSPTVKGPAPARMEWAAMRHAQYAVGASQVVTLAYHATAIHAEEHHFLLPIVEAVLAARPSAHFEVIATGSSAALWLRLNSERVTVIQPMAWPDYLKSQNKKIDIMLVPVAPNHLNDCRADTKRIDVARVGAAAVMSDCSAYLPAEEGEILLPYQQTAWIDRLISLVDDADARELAARATLRRVENMAAEAISGIGEIKVRTELARVEAQQSK